MLLGYVLMPNDCVFLLSPANTAGKRAGMLLREEASFPLAVRLREEGAPLGEVFSFTSGLYFRGKLTYARRFAPAGASHVITSCRGLLSPDTIVGPDDLRCFGEVPIDPAEPRYRQPLENSARELRDRVGAGPSAPVVLLGSVASDKYVDILLDVFGHRLRFPEAFVGRGDMSRGALLLRQAEEGRELGYVRASDAERRGSRPPRLERRP